MGVIIIELSVSLYIEHWSPNINLLTCVYAYLIYSERALNELLPLAHKIYFKVHLYASYSHVIEAETINKVQILFSAPSSCTTMCVA